MRIELKPNNMLRLSKDISSPSCGENRAEWELIEIASLEHLVKSLERLVTGKSKVEFI